MTDQEKNYFPALTGFRALAAYMVFFHHANPFNPSSRWLLYSILNELYIGVSLFFVLSGFLIYWRYNDLFANHQNRFKAYIQNRFARIYPLYFVLTCITFIALFLAEKLQTSGESIVVIVSNVTLFKGFFNDLKFTGIPQSWSLTVEECFYALAPLIFLWWNKSRLLTIAGVMLTGVSLVFIFRNVDYYGLFSDFDFVMVYTFFGRCFEFFAGIALAQYFKTHNTYNSSRRSTYSGLAGIILTVSGLVAVRGNAPYGIDQPIGIVLNNFILPLFVVLFMHGLIAERTAIRRVLSSNAFQLLGRSSYAFYLLHNGIFFSGIYRYISQNTAVIFLLINILAIACYYFIESPIHRRWKGATIIS